MIKHIAIIMDGNRRYSNINSISKSEGYKAGMLKFIEFVKWQVKYNIKEMSFFALSCDNYNKRPISEKKIVYNLMNFFSEDKSIKQFFIENKIKIKLIGDISGIKENEQKMPLVDRFFIEKLEKEFNEWNNKNQNYQFYVNIALNYDGQKEIIDSCKKIFEKIKSNELNIEQLNEKRLKKYMYTSSSNPPEIIVRPGNVPRLSGFLLWDSKYSEIYFTKKLWPQLEETDFLEIIDWYKKIQRNFGK